MNERAKRRTSTLANAKQQVAKMDPAQRALIEEQFREADRQADYIYRTHRTSDGRLHTTT